MSDPKMLFHMVPGGPKPVAPFSHAVECDGWVFVTGQMPDSPANLSVLPDGIEAQTRNVMANLTTVLNGIGLGLQHVVMVRIYLAHFATDYAPMNDVYSTFFPEGRRAYRSFRARPRGPASAVRYVDRHIRPAASRRSAPGSAPDSQTQARA